MKNIQKLIGTLLIVAGLGMVVYFGYTYIYTKFEQQKLEKGFKVTMGEDGEPAAPTSTTPKVNPEDQKYYDEIKESNAFAKLVIPKIELDIIVVEGTRTEDLKKGPGHITGSALPGEIGNTAISGHRVTYGAPFGRLDELEAGDAIIIYTPNARYVYQIYGKKVVLPSDVSVIQPTKDRQLTLTACHPPHSARYRLIIQSRLISK